MTNEKHFPKTISQWEFYYDLFTNLLSLATFLRVHSNSEEVSYLSWQNTYPNLKTTCHIKLKFFLWTKLLENLLLTKYLISVGAPISRVAIISGHVYMLNSAFQFIVRFIFQGAGGGEGARSHESRGWVRSIACSFDVFLLSVTRYWIYFAITELTTSLYSLWLF